VNVIATGANILYHLQNNFILDLNHEVVVLYLLTARRQQI